MLIESGWSGPVSSPTGVLQVGAGPRSAACQRASAMSARATPVARFWGSKAGVSCAFHIVYGARQRNVRRPRASVVRRGRGPAVSVLRRDFRSRVGIRSEGERGRSHGRPLRVPHDRFRFPKPNGAYEAVKQDACSCTQRHRDAERLPPPGPPCSPPVHRASRFRLVGCLCRGASPPDRASG